MKTELSRLPLRWCAIFILGASVAAWSMVWVIVKIITIAFRGGL